MKVFISYSRRDLEIVRQIEVALKPLVLQGILDAVWRDDAIEAGVKWEEVLHTELELADIVLACLSIDALASEWCRREWAFAIAQRKLVLPCMLRECELGASGLQHYQAIAGAEPLSAAPDRDAWMTRLYRDVEQAVHRARDARGPDGRVEATGLHRALVERLCPDDASRTAPDQVLQIVVEGAGPFTLRWLLDDEPVAPAASRTRGPRADDVLAQLGGDAAGVTIDALIGLGEVLYDWLLPEPARTQVLERLDPELVHPEARPVRLVLSIEDPVLAGLPWRLIAYEGELLARRWTVEHRGAAVVQGSLPVVALEPADGVLLVAPSTDDRRLAPRWFADVLRQHVANSPHLASEPGLQVARTMADLQRIAPLPSVVVVHAALRTSRRGLRIAMPDASGDPAWLNLADLPHGGQAKLLLLDGPVDGDPVALPAAVRDTWAAVALRGVSGTPWQASWASLGWLDAVVQQGRDPVAAAGARPTEPASALALATLQVYARFSGWRVRRVAMADVARNAIRRVDRHTQRQAARGAALDAVQRYRVLAIAGFGDREDGVAQLGEQILAHLRTHRGDDLELVNVPVDHPFPDPDFAASFDDAEPGPGWFERRAAELAGLGRTALFFFDWGVLDASTDAGPLVDAWCAAMPPLVDRCPASARFVHLVAVAGDREVDRPLGAALKRALRPHVSRGVELELLPRLGLVSEDDLFHFLRTEECDCRDELAWDVAQVLHRRTQGEWAPVIEAIELAERDGWDGLYAEARALGA